MYVIHRTRTTATMTSQDVVFYEDTFQIHIEKEYHNGSLILEKHYDTMGKCIYSFYDDMSIRYYYPIQKDMQDTIFYALVMFNDSQKLKKVRHGSSANGNTYTEGTNEINYDIDLDSCTHLCTLNNIDAIEYIKKYIIKSTLQYHGL